jgi:hypothetical protein
MLSGFVLNFMYLRCPLCNNSRGELLCMLFDIGMDLFCDQFG